jgi:hypothetical protein
MIYRINPVTDHKYEHRYYIEYKSWFRWKKIYAKGSDNPLIVEGIEDAFSIARAFAAEPKFDPCKIMVNQPLVR